MSANTAQKLFEKLWQFWVFSIWPLLLGEKRLAKDLLDFLQMVKDRPKDFGLHVGVLRNTHRIVGVEKPSAAFILDTTNASMPRDWEKGGFEVEEHKSLGVIIVSFVGGEMYIGNHKVDEYITEYQAIGCVGGRELHVVLADKPVLPDAILDLLIHEQDNPGVAAYLQKYRGVNSSRPYFWGTTYRGPDGYRRVRSLSGLCDQFHCDNQWLDFCFYAAHPALVLALPSSESGT